MKIYYHYPKGWTWRAAAHYRHACEKHPHFADKTFSADTLENCKAYLANCREMLAKEIAIGTVYAEDILLEELLEVAEAIADGDKAHAVEEIYDAIAVLLRMADMIEKEQIKQ